MDGQLARYTGNFSGFEAWLDTGCDRAKEYLVYAGLALGSTHGFGEDVWLLAACALALQTIRHMADFAWVVVRPAGGDAPLTPSRWLRPANQLIRLPIAERFALISLTAAVASPHVTFVTLLAWGGLGAVFALSVRVGLLSSSVPSGRGAVNALRLYRDDGLLAPLLRAPERPSRFGWLAPPAWRVVEYGSADRFHLPFRARAPAVLLRFSRRARLPPLRLRLPAADRGASPPPAWVGLVGGGWEIRVALAGILALAARSGPRCSWPRSCSDRFGSARAR